MTELLPKEISRVLYLDCDTLVCNDIQKIWEQDMSDFMAAGVLDCMDKDYTRKIGLGENDVYINSGVILFNLENIRKCNLEKKFEKVINEKGNLFKYPDQDAINVTMKDNIKVIPMEYNVISQCLLFEYKDYMYYRNGARYYNEMQYDIAKQNFCILHMTGGFAYARPWFEKSAYPYKQLFDKYYIMANSITQYWGKDNRSMVQKLVALLYANPLPGKKWILRFLRKINNR